MKRSLALNATYTLGSVILLLCCCAQVHAQSSRPNVLFIAVDDLNDWISLFGGHPKAITPNMDRLAHSGAMVFQNAHCAGPVCCPSRSAMLSGFMPSRSGIYSNSQNMLDAPLVQTHATLPEYFSKHGYYSLSMGKISHKTPTCQWDYPTVTINGHGNASVCDNRWRFIRYSDGTEELYDMQEDPQEWHNLITRPSSQGEAAMERLGKLLPKTFAEPIPYSKGKYKKVNALDTTIKSTRDLAKLK